MGTPDTVVLDGRSGQVKCWECECNTYHKGDTRGRTDVKRKDGEAACWVHFSIAMREGGYVNIGNKGTGKSFVRSWTEEPEEKEYVIDKYGNEVTREMRDDEDWADAYFLRGFDDDDDDDLKEEGETVKVEATSEHVSKIFADDDIEVTDAITLCELLEERFEADMSLEEAEKVLRARGIGDGGKKAGLLSDESLQRILKWMGYAEVNMALFHALEEMKDEEEDDVGYEFKYFAVDTDGVYVARTKLNEDGDPELDYWGPWQPDDEDDEDVVEATMVLKHFAVDGGKTIYTRAYKENWHCRIDGWRGHSKSHKDEKIQVSIMQCADQAITAEFGKE